MTMDVIQPELIKIGNRFYRKNPIKLTENQENQMAPYREEEIDVEEECESEELDIRETKHDFRLSLPIPTLFHRFIIGSRGRTRQQIELETHTKIQLPHTGQTGPVIISAQDKRGIVSAKTRIDLLIVSARKRCDITHFVCLPVRAAALTERINEFKAEVAEHCVGDRGLDPSLYQETDKLHLTVSVFVLADDREIANAKEFLHTWYRQRQDPVNPFELELEGLEIMNDDPSAVDVLYIKIKKSPELDRLHQFANELQHSLCSNGFARHEDRGVKLHITLMNSKYREKTSPSKDSSASNSRETFDATNLLSRYQDFNFGSVTIREIHLSQLHRVGDDGFYWPALVLRL